MAQDLTGLVQEQIADIALPTLQALVPAFRAFSTDINSDPISSDAGSVKVPLIADPSAQEHTGDYSANSEVSGDSYAEVAQTEFHPVSNFRLTEAERIALSNGTQSLVVTNRIRGAVNAVGKYAITKILAKALKASFASERVITAANFDGTTLGQLRTLAETLNFGMNRSVLVPASYMETLVGDPQLAAYFAAADRQAVAEGRIARAKGFDLIECNYIPTNNQNLVGIAADPRCFAVTARPVAIDDSTQSVLQMADIVSDADSGLAMTMSSFVDPKTRVAYYTLEMYLGVTKGQGAALIRIVSAAT